MKYQPITAADAVYTATANSTITHLTARDDGVQCFSAAVAALTREVRSDATDPYWREPLYLLKKARFALLSTPLPYNAQELLLLQRLILVQHALENCREVYPQSATAVEAACDALGQLYLRHDNPLGDEIARDADRLNPGRAAVILASRGLEQAVRTNVAKLLDRDIDVVSPAVLAEKRPYDTLYIVGSPAWFAHDEWLFTAPRGSTLRLVSYEWVRATLPERQLFASSVLGGSAPALPPRLNAVGDQPPADRDADDLLPTIDWQLIVGESGAAGASLGDPEAVDALPVVLARGYGAFLSAEPGASVQVLVPDASPKERIHSIPTAEVSAGTYVLLRREGGGDYLVPLADRLLGDGAEQLRQMQREWKQLLQVRVDEAGLDATAAALVSAGCARANRANLRNWLSPRSLRTWDFTDFAAIMKFVGLASEAERYWAAMGKLDEAHQRAGFEIRKQLNQQAATEDLSNLDEEGGIDFTLPGRDAGTLTALRVENVSPDTVAVLPSRLNELFKLRGELWHA